VSPASIFATLSGVIVLSWALFFLCTFNEVEQNHINEDQFVSLTYPYGYNS